MQLKQTATTDLPLRYRIDALDEPQQPSGAHHSYVIHDADTGHPVANVQFQRGPRNVEGSVPGILDSHLLEIVKHRYECFQSGQFACEHNAEVLAHVVAALNLMEARAQERLARGVLGTNAK